MIKFKRIVGFFIILAEIFSVVFVFKKIFEIIYFPGFVFNTIKIFWFIIIAYIILHVVCQVSMFTLSYIFFKTNDKQENFEFIKDK